MTPGSVMAIAGGLIAMSALISWLMSISFCTRPVPRGVRAWRDVALALIGARAMYVGVAGDPASWWSAALWLWLAIWGVLIAFWKLRDALVDGSRCYPGDGDDS